jgi:enoyl-CoA hydratase/carnithine racemase
MHKSAFVVSRENEAHVATVTLTRPEFGNKLMTDDIRSLGRAILSAGREPEVKAVLVKAQGDQFCMGRDPGPAAPNTKSALQTRTSVTEPILGLYADLRATPVPVIAVVQGEARGFGCAFVGQCDLAIAAEPATFSLPEMDTDLPPTLAISAVLGKVALKRLMHLVYTREKIWAKEALELGLLSEVVPALELEKAAAKTVARLTDRSRSALEAVKEYMAIAPHLDPVAASRYASALLSVVLSSNK